MNKKKIVLCGAGLIGFLILNIIFHVITEDSSQPKKKATEWTAEVIQEIPKEKLNDTKNKAKEEVIQNRKGENIRWSHEVEVNGISVTLPIRLDRFLELVQGSYHVENETGTKEQVTDTEDYNWLVVEADGRLVDVYVAYREGKNNLDSSKYVMGIQQNFNETTPNVSLPGNIKKGATYEQVEKIYGTPNEKIVGSGETVYKYYNPKSQTMKQNEYMIIVFSDNTEKVDYVLNYYDGTSKIKE